MSLGKDLASIRKSQNLTLEDIQNAIKIPLSTLKSIENGSIFSDPSENKTYVRSFVRSYAKVLKIDDEEIVKALDEMEAGTYSGSLMGESSEESHEPSPDTFPTETEQTKETPASNENLEIEKAEKETRSKAPRQTDSEDLDTINWADMGRKFTTASKSSRVWVFILFFVILGAIGTTGYYFWDEISGFFETNSVNTTQSTSPETDQQAIPPAPLDTAETVGQEPIPEPLAEVQNQPEPQNNEPIRLGDTLTLAVYAAYGQLEPIRVTSDLNWRTNPFWMEEGEAYNFDFRDTLLVRGQYSRLLLLFNGHVIENPRQNHFDPSFNSIMITRSVLDQPRYLAPPPQQFPLSVGPPDSTVYRIRY